MTFLSSLCGKWSPLSAAYQHGSEIHLWQGLELKTAVASLFIDMIGEFPFHTTPEMTVGSENNTSCLRLAILGDICKNFFILFFILLLHRTLPPISDL